MQFNSSYEFIKYLVEQDPDFCIEAPDWNYTHAVSIEINHKLPEAEKLHDALADLVIENLYGVFSSNCTIFPKVDASGNLIFAISNSYHSHGEQFDKELDRQLLSLHTPNDQGFECELEKIGLLVISMDVLYENGQFKKYDINIVHDEYYCECETENELAKVRENVTAMNLSYKKYLKEAIVEFAQSIFTHVDSYSMSFEDNDFSFPFDKFEEFNMQWTESLSDEVNEEFAQQLCDNRVYIIE